MSTYKVIRGNELYLYMNGKLIFKKWIDAGHSKVFDLMAYDKYTLTSIKQATPEIHIRRTDSDNKNFQQMVLDLDKYLAGINGDNNDFFVQYNKTDLIKNVVVAYYQGEAVGCGAIKEYGPHTAEIKRMFVRIENRGKGIATIVLQELENWAKELGYNQCVLETDQRMADAIALYSKNGYTRIPNYGQYADVPSSVCFSKEI